MQILRGRTTGIDSLAISPDSRYVAVCGLEGYHVWDLYDLELKARAIFKDSVALARLQFTSATSLFARGARHWSRHDLATGADSAPRLPGRVRSHNDILHPTRRLLKAVSRNDNVETFRVTDSGFDWVGSAVPIPHPYLMGFDPAGERYLVGVKVDDLSGHSWQLSDTATDTLIVSLQLTPSSWLGRESCHFSPDGRRLYVFGEDHLRVFNCDMGGPPGVQAEIPSGDYTFELAVHPDGRVLVTVENEREVTFRDAEMLQVIRTYDFNMPKVTCVAFTPDGTRCVVGNSRGKVLLFDVE